ncbi:ABC transporter ATP-binding protein [Brevibacillus fluminis]|uniref:ABC transporter ATP-binding protein n=1 Tax=Brevibacillus fluminis TaxID=511487 RepID=UPI003F893130
MIEVVEASKRFGPLEAVSQLSFTVNPGEVVGLLGENGAGKTTTMRLISGILQPSDGEIRIGGILTSTEPLAARKQVGLLFGGDVGLYGRLTAWENIAYFGRLYGMTEQQLRERIAQASKKLGMESYVRKRVAGFSRGMRQKVAIARALVHDPPVVLLDEPTTGLDVSGALVFRELIAQLRQEGKAILFSSHNMSEVKKLCDRVVLMHKGRIRFQGTIEEWRAPYDSDDPVDWFLPVVQGGGCDE